MKGISFLAFILLSSCASTPHDGSQVLNESLRQCYVESDSYTGKNGSVQGSMDVELFLGPDGKTQTCKIIKNDFKDPNLDSCVCEIFKLSFLPASADGKSRILHQPVKFHPVQQ